MPRPQPRSSVGGKRMKELGYKPIQIWLDKEEMARIKKAAEKDGRPVTRFVARAALKECAFFGV